MTPSQTYSSTAEAAETIDKPEELVHLKVRVYAGAGYRAETVRWRERIEEQIEAAGKVTREQFNFDLQVVQIVEWQPQSDGSNLQQVLAELRGKDPADDVDFVIGMTKSLAAFQPSIHLLGMAESYGQHIVLRAMNDAAEREHFDQAFDELTDEERDRLYGARLEHKETSVVLHELGHALGAVHTREPTWLMGAASSTEQQAFGPANTRIIRLAVKLRAEHDSHDAWRRAFLKGLLEELDGPYRDAFDPRARERSVALAKAYLDVNVLTRREATRLQRTRELAGQGRFDEAWKHLQPLASSRQHNPPVMAAACYVRSRASGMTDATREQCELAFAVAKENPSPALMLAIFHLERDERDEALAMIDEGRRRIDAAERVEGFQWLSLARLYAEAGALTRSEDAIAKVPMMKGAQEVREHLADVRNFFGVKKGAVQPDEEAEYVYQARKAAELLDKRQNKEAKAIIDALAESHADVAATQALRCQLAGNSSDLRGASKACKRALELDDNCALGHMMSGYLAMLQNKQGATERHFVKARDLVPSNVQLWVALAGYYRRVGKKTALAKLQDDFEARFGTEIPMR
jgi:predicted Zn-dependent protease